MGREHGRWEGGRSPLGAAVAAAGLRRERPHERRSRWLRATVARLLRRSELDRPDGRPLHRYQATDAELEALRNLLRANFRRHFPERGKHISAAFCLFVAYWFQRHGGTGHWSWDGPAGALEAELDHAGRTRLTDAGLIYWQRPLRKREDGTRLYLASLIVEGGLPQPALVRPGWLGGYLGRVIADLERGHHSDSETASRHAPPIDLWPRFVARCAVPADTQALLIGKLDYEPRRT